MRGKKAKKANFKRPSFVKTRQNNDNNSYGPAKRPASQPGGQGSKRRRKEMRAAQFGGQPVQSRNSESQFSDPECELSQNDSDSDTNPYEKLINLLRPDVNEPESEQEEQPEEVESDASNGDGEEGEEEEEEGEEEEDEEEDDDDDGMGEDDEVGDGSEQDAEDRDGPEALKELGLDAVQQSSDEEGSERSESDAEENVDDNSDSFNKNFQNMHLDEASAKSYEASRNSVKWRRRELDGVPGTMLWRAGKDINFPSAISKDATSESLDLEPKLLERWNESNADKEKDDQKQISKSGAPDSGHSGRGQCGLTELQRGLLPLMNSYLDVLYNGRRTTDAEQLREILVLHTLNHINKSRRIVQKNNLSLKKRPDADARDQGFTRCKVLVLLPCRNSAYLFIRKLLALCPSACAPSGRIDGEDRFEEDFSPGSKAERKADRERLMQVGEDHFERFEGNVDDHFRVGIQLQNKYARLFAPFYASDLIVASPLGLRMIVKAAGDKGREYDFLSSIEVLIIDQLDYLLMQNVDHMYTVVDAINKAPQQSRGVDFSRLREPFLDDTQRFLRQTIILSAHATPEGNALISRHAFNVRGVVKTEEALKGSIRHVLDQIHARQTFHRLPDTPTLAAADQARFDFFREHVYRRLSQTGQTHTLVVVPSYMQFVQVRNFLNKEEADWQECTEYSSVTQVSHARSALFHGRCELLVITERFHFYHRFRLRGVHHVIFYGLPQFASFYSEIVNLVSLGQERGVSVTAVYSRLDKLSLQAIVGSARAQRMLDSDKAVHLFA